MVDIIITFLNLSVALIMPDLYKNNIENNAKNVKPTAFTTIPLNKAWYEKLIEPINNP